MKTFILSFVIIIISIRGYSQESNFLYTHPDWECIFSDEFNTGSLDPDKWKASQWTGRCWEWWNPANIDFGVEDGDSVLILNATKDICPYTDCRYEEDGVEYIKQYSAAEINTKTTMFKYGYFEAKIKVPYKQGFFPAFWLSVKSTSGFDATWPPELDVLEYSGTGDYVATGTNQIIDCDEDGAIANRSYEIDKSTEEPYNNFFIYAMEWNEHEVKWYINNVQVGSTLTTEIPHDFMRLVLSLQLRFIPSSGLGDLNSPLKKMYVDWVRVYKPINAPIEGDYDKWDQVWHNSNTGMLGEWDLREDDINVAGDFDADAVDELLNISGDNIYAKLHKYDDQSSVWTKLWGNGASGLIQTWQMGTGDKYLSGNFDGVAGDELLCIASNNLYVRLLYYNNQSPNWYSMWGNGGNSWIGENGWNTYTNDKYYIYDMNNDGRDDLICFSANSMSCKIVTYDSGSWTTLYGNGGGSTIVSTTGNTWNMSSTDNYNVGDFNGNGKGDLLLINEVTGYAKLFEFNDTYGNNDWVSLWGNAGNGTIGSWNFSYLSRYYSVNIDNKTELFCISPENKYEKTLDYNGSWNTSWGNAGSYQIYNRDISNNDKFCFGRYLSNSTQDELLWLKSAWSEDCNTYHAYLHKLPVLVILNNRSLSNINKISKDNVKVYPNPGKGKIKVIPTIDSKYTISIYNGYGQQIFNDQFSEKGIVIDIENQPNGIYILKYDDTTNIYYEKIIKE